MEVVPSAEAGRVYAGHAVQVRMALLQEVLGLVRVPADIQRGPHVLHELAKCLGALAALAVQEASLRRGVRHDDVRGLRTQDPVPALARLPQRPQHLRPLPLAQLEGAVAGGHRTRGAVAGREREARAPEADLVTAGKEELRGLPLSVQVRQAVPLHAELARFLGAELLQDVIMVATHEHLMREAFLVAQPPQGAGQLQPLKPRVEVFASEQVLAAAILVEGFPIERARLLEADVPAVHQEVSWWQHKMLMEEVCV
mmetsp:Transcript_86593/g.240082  ORF Transcript_86593/g.240082 Transcript_86593/m.240082 type:complete len:256 (-) Transcript_86593:562-1329(-)